ncbi:MAG: TspO/MBR family protein, partial [Snowella sp.]
MISLPSWLVIAFITFAIAFPLSQLSERDRRWFFRLRRPRWLTFEGLIPFIWISIFICGIASASTVWEANPGNQKTWILMGIYLVLELLILAYTPVMCKFRSLIVGTIIGGVGFIWGVFLAVMIWQVSGLGLVLILPYLLWSPVG